MMITSAQPVARRKASSRSRIDDQAGHPELERAA